MPPIDRRQYRHRLPDALSRLHHNITPPPRSIPAPDLMVGRLSGDRQAARLRSHKATVPPPNVRDPIDGLGFGHGKATISDVAFIKRFHKQIKAHNRTPGARIIVTVTTSSSGSRGANKALLAERKDAVARMLRHMGFERFEVRGKMSPPDGVDDPADRAAHFQFVGAQDTLDADGRQRHAELARLLQALE